MKRVTVAIAFLTVIPSLAGGAQVVDHRAEHQHVEDRSEARRDPFASLLEPVASPSPKRVITSLADVSLHENTLKGIERFGGSHLAVVLAPDRKTYLLRLQERLRDATLRSLTSDAAIFALRVLEPSSSVIKEREVIKFLRPRGENR
jgi:hypothetical protein